MWTKILKVSFTTCLNVKPSYKCGTKRDGRRLSLSLSTPSNHTHNNIANSKLSSIEQRNNCSLQQTAHLLGLSFAKRLYSELSSPAEGENLIDY